MSTRSKSLLLIVLVTLMLSLTLIVSAAPLKYTCGNFCDKLPQLDFRSNVPFTRLVVRGLNQNNTIATWQWNYSSRQSRQAIANWWWNPYTQPVTITITTARGIMSCNWIGRGSATYYPRWIQVTLTSNGVCAVQAG